MSSHEPQYEREKIDFLQIISLFLSLYVLGELVVDRLFKLSPEMVDLFSKIDFFICFFFLGDFFYRFYKAPSKLLFLKWGWIDFVSSIPVWGVFQWARIARVFRILRALRSTKIVVHHLYRDRTRGTLGTAILIAVVMILFSAIAILNFEDAPNSNIKNPDDAIWWAFTTISTVGYGDKYPVTTGGRMVAVLLITSGVGLFGVYTAFIASLFVQRDDKNGRSEISILIDEVRSLRLRVEELKNLQDRTEPADLLEGEKRNR